MHATDDRPASGTLPAVLSADEWTELRARMEQRRYAAGDVIIEQGTIAPDFHIIAQGIVSISALAPDGVRRELGALGADEAIGDMSLLTGEPASADVIATNEVRTYAASQERIATLGDLRTRLIEGLATLLAGRLRRSNERLLAQYSATTHAVACAPQAIAPLVRLPAEVARCVGAPVLALIAGDAASAAWSAEARTPGRDVSVRLVPGTGVDDIPRVIGQAQHEYDRIIVFGEPPAGIDARGWEVVREAERARDGAKTAVISALAWTQPNLRRLSEQAHTRVEAIVPPASPAPGRRDPIAKLARTITDRRIGVALGAGGAKGFAHIGVLRAFDEIGVPIDMLAGSSIGAAVAAGYAAGYSVEQLSHLAGRIAGRAVRPTLPLHSFLSNRGIRDELARVAEGRRFEDLDLPLAVCATDIFRRCEVTFTSGVVLPHLVASMSIPGIYPALKTPDSYLVDGAVLNPVPSRQCRELGAGIVVAVRLTGKNTSPRDELDFRRGRPLAPETIMRALEIMHNRLSELSKNEADVNIEVCIERGGLRDFDRSAEIVQAGYDAASAARDELVAAVPCVEAAA
ncbi:MAG TPA: cyclic nucleotide-binding and patatin-like phospholipase domain-containing protein [Dehalococcoidia bacterium]|nr:cyclic nucleotide-binding and patatin-like phospholipase domain-containing protein [Dehalococcoidia bacterium]